jgi:hypothetical protein
LAAGVTLPKFPTRPPDDVVESWPESARRYVSGLERVLGQLLESVRVGEEAVREAKRQAVPFRRPASKRATKRGKPGRKGGHAVQRRAIPPAIDEEVVAAAPDTCACGGTDIVEAGSYEQLHDVRDDL